MVSKIIKNDLCLGCGLCESLFEQNKCHMELNGRGFYVPCIREKLTKSENKIVKQVCPGIHISAHKNKGEWGTMEDIAEAWSTNKDIRYKAASGGVVTSVAICLLEQKIVDAVLQVGVQSDSYLYNELKVSCTHEDVLKNAQSRYAPALVFKNIKQIFDDGTKKYAFIGKPCDIAALKNFLKVFPQYKARVVAFISIFCAGMPSYNATIEALQMSGKVEKPVKLKYRGDGWPGYFSAKWNDGTDYRMSYNDSWGKVLNKHIGFRCKICPDGIGMLSDIAVGDSWNTKNGYPDFTESDGRSFVIIRTNIGDKIMNVARQAGYIERHTLDINKIREMQPYQYERRKLVGWRQLPVQILTGGILHFSGLKILQLALSANIIVGVRNMVGTVKRLLKVKINGQH